MAIINSISGYYGYTVDDNNNTSNNNGQVNKCIIAFVYPPYKNDVIVTISNGEDDWGIKMGDDSIIPIKNPNILFTNSDNCIVEFNMTTLYPSNSPCTLVYRSDSASISMVESSGSTNEFEVNSVSGHFAFTTNSYGSDVNDNGEVNKLIATIPFPHQVSAVDVTISNGEDDWGARMGDGSIIAIRNPEIIRVNFENVIVKFDMNEMYPANSPCILVYRSESANIDIKTTDDDNDFHPVTNIIDVPNKCLSGDIIDLNIAKVLPWNASNQKIDWSVISGNATIRDQHLLVINNKGTIQIRGTIENGLEGSDDSNDYVKTFKIVASDNIITILSQPTVDVRNYYGKITSEISVVAKSTSDNISFQWYRCNNKNYASPVKLDGETQSKFKIPKSLQKGEYFYYCELTSNGAPTVKTTCSRVYIDYELTAISITPRTNTLPFGGSRKLDISWTPSNADKPKVIWRSSDSYKVNVDADGNIQANLLPGNITITCETVDGKLRDSIPIVVDTFVSVNNITLNMNTGETDTNYSLGGVVSPTNASYRSITWSIVNKGTTNATISNGILRAPNEGIIKIRATIEKGLTLNSPFIRDFDFIFTQKFIPVTDIELLNDTSGYYINDIITISSNIIPSNASKKDIKWSIKMGEGVLNNDDLIFTNTGNITISATIKNGIGSNRDFSKDFVLRCDYKEFTSVSSVSLKFKHSDSNVLDNTFDPNEYISEGEFSFFNIPYEISPNDSTNKNATISIDNIYSQDIVITEIVNNDGMVVKIVENFDETKWTIDHTNAVICNDNMIKIDQNNFNFNKYYKVDLKFIIENGKTKTEDFECILVAYVYHVNVDEFISVTDVIVEKPSIFRTYYPILLDKYKVVPPNASVKSEEGFIQNLTTRIERKNELEGANYLTFFMENITDDSFIPVDLLPLFEFSSYDRVLLPFEPGSIVITSNIREAYIDDNGVKQDYTITENIKFVEPFIPVRDISGIPSEIYCNQKYYLSGEIETKEGTRHDAPRWDEELSSYNNIRWSIINDNNRSATITDDGDLFVSSTGKIKIRATIDSGVAEYIDWYEKIQEKQDFVKDFEINVLPEESLKSEYIAKIKLLNNEYIEIFRSGDIQQLCSDRPSDSIITIGDVSFKKSDVKSIKFIDRRSSDTEMDVPEYSTLRNFGRNMINLTEINRIPDVTGNDCLRNFLMGCTSFNMDLEVPSNVSGDRCLMYFLRGCTSFNSNISIPNGIVGIHTLHGFLADCTDFNSPINIPNDITGEGSLERFLYNCIKFNQAIEIPSGLSGYACLRRFMYNCKSFNRPITLPDNVGKISNEDILDRLARTSNVHNREINYTAGRQLNEFMMECRNMCSTVTVPLETGKYAGINNLSFSLRDTSGPIIDIGITLNGEGSEFLLERLSNSYPNMENHGTPPYYHYTNLDNK